MNEVKLSLDQFLENRKKVAKEYFIEEYLKGRRPGIIVEEIADMLDIKTPTVYKLIKARKLKEEIDGSRS